MVDLQRCREKIDKIDKQIAELFEERMIISKEVAAYKIETGKPVLDKEREEKKLEEVEKLVHGKFNKSGIRELYTQLMAISRRYQYSLLGKEAENGSWMERFCVERETRIAFYGKKGTYTEQAMEEFFGVPIDGIPTSSFRGVMQAVSAGEVAYGVLPIENTSTGGITDIYDLLVEYENHIVGEQVIKIDHVLLGLPEATLGDITDVYTHGQPLLQCKTFLEKHPEWRQHEYGSTADSAQKIIRDGKKNQAAIAGRRAAEYYGLKVLVDQISMDKGNSTRFIVIAKNPTYQEGANKLSLCFEIPHISGSLYTTLAHFMFNELNMTSIASRPIPGKRWEYRFFVDIVGNLKEEAVKNAIEGIRAEVGSLLILGNYKQAE